MNYNEWKNEWKQDDDGTPWQYVEYCRKNQLRPDLRGGDLCGADLSGAYLGGANLRGANLRGAYLCGAYLSGANLSDADLRGVDLGDADLSGANLRDADLRDADLRGVDLGDADLRHADLGGTSGPFTLGYFGRHHAVAAGGYIAIGCERHSYGHWLENYEAIGLKNEYSDQERADYGVWIQLAVARQRRIEEAGQ